MEPNTETTPTELSLVDRVTALENAIVPIMPLLTDLAKIANDAEHKNLFGLFTDAEGTLADFNKLKSDFANIQHIVTGR